jgi:hypothetical protein
MSQIIPTDQLSVCRTSFLRAHELLAKFPFPLIKTGVNGQQLESLTQLTVSKTSSYDFFGKPADVYTWVSRQLLMAGNSEQPDAVSAAATLVHNLVYASIQPKNSDGVWVAMRSFLPGDIKQLCWNQDSNYVGKSPGQFKVVVTLRGQATLFPETLPDIAQVRRLQHQLTNLHNPNDPRTSQIQVQINEFFANCKVTSAGSPLRAAIFKPGLDGAFYSEPIVTEPRWSVSIVPGTLGEVMELKERSGIK